MRTHCCGNFETNQCCNDCPITAQILPQPIPVATPAWHDAPNATGLWVCMDAEGNDQSYQVDDAEKWASEVDAGDRWYGPIPEDKQS